jgi:hypothetical protein
MKWSKADKVDYQKWIRENFVADVSSQAQIAIRQAIRDEVEDDMSDEILQTKKEVSMPIFTLREGFETMEIDIIPGTIDSFMVIDEIARVTRGLHFVILRRKVKGGFIKGIVELEHCGDRVKHIVAEKMIQIVSEAQVEPKLSKMELNRIDTTLEGPNSLLGMTWKAKWIAVQGLNRNLMVYDKVTVINALIKSLQLNNTTDGKQLFTDEAIEAGVRATQLRNELNDYINIILIRTTEEIEIS